MLAIGLVKKSKLISTVDIVRLIVKIVCKVVSFQGAVISSVASFPSL